MDPWSLFKTYVDEIRGNALWDLTKWLFVGALALLVRAGWRRIRAVSSDTWLREAASFTRLGGEHATAMRELGVSSGRVKWSIYPKNRSSKADLEAFREAAKHAGELVRRGRLLHDAPDDPEDAWYELVYQLTLPDNDTRIEGSGQGELHQANVLEALSQRSATACAKLANGERPPRRRLKVGAGA